MHPLLLSLLVITAPPTTTKAKPTAADPVTEAMLCDVARELRVAVMYGSEAEDPGTALVAALGAFQCLKIYALPSGFSMVGDEIPEGATRLADRIGVDWMITVSPESNPGYVTARLIETSNLQVVKAATSSGAGVAGGLMRAIYDAHQAAKSEGVRINLVLEPSSYGLARGLENAARGVKNVVSAGGARIVDGKSLVVVVYQGSVDRLADALRGLPIGKSKLEVKAVKMRRIELSPVDGAGAP